MLSGLLKFSNIYFWWTRRKS